MNGINESTESALKHAHALRERLAMTLRMVAGNRPVPLPASKSTGPQPQPEELGLIGKSAAVSHVLEECHAYVTEIEGAFGPTPPPNR